MDFVATDSPSEFEVWQDGVHVGSVWQNVEDEWVAQSSPFEIVAGFASRDAAGRAILSGEV